MKNVKKFWLPAMAVALAMGACSSDNEPGEELTVAPTLPEEVEFELTAAEKAAASHALVSSPLSPCSQCFAGE